MHVFGAADNYIFAGGEGPTDRRGYLDIVNANGMADDGKGYFGGRGEGQDDIMIGRGPIGVYTRGQVGWRDSDGDGILEPLDTYPETTIIEKTGDNPITYSGKVSDMPLLTEYNSRDWQPFGSVTLNTITDVQYRINRGAWCSVESMDGAFDSGEEMFTFTTPVLGNGNYLIEIKATNSVGNTETSYAKDEVEITGNPVTNVRPCALFSAVPREGSIQTNFTLDASLSSDIEDDIADLQVRWDFENDGTWDTSFSYDKVITFNYDTPGAKACMLEVKDSGGLTHINTKQVNVAATNIPPTALFTVTPENEHGIEGPFSVQFDATRSWDGEDDTSDLSIRWDFEDDGIWDTDYANNFLTEHSYQLPMTLPNALLDFPDISYVGGVCVSGTYAYVVGWAQDAYLYVVDISDPLMPDIVASYYVHGGDARDISISGNLAYIACSNPGVLRIVDISNPLSPQSIGSYNANADVFSVFAAGNYVYIAGGRTGGLQIVDITIPSNPRLIGSCNTPDTARDVYVVDNYAYIADGTSGLQIIDISNSAAPVIIGNYDTPDNASGVNISGNYAYIADGESGLQIIDISNPTNPAFIGDYDTSNFAWELSVSGSYAYVANCIAGLEIIDVSNPTTPVSIGSFDTPGSARGMCISGAYAYIENDAYGLIIMDISYPFQAATALLSTHFRAKAEVLDGDGNTSQATRDMWVNTYNHPPVLQGDIQINADVANWELIGSCNAPGHVYDTAVSGNFAYIADYDAGLHIVDISNPAMPHIIGSYSELNYISAVFVVGNYAYIATGVNGLHIIDVTNPETPTLVGSCATSYWLEDVHVSGQYAYVASRTSGLEIIDISNPPTLTVVGSCPTPGNAYETFVSGDYAYVADKSSGLQVIDISNPSAPTIVGSYDTTGYAYGIFILGNFAYVADDTDGLCILNIADPTTPVFVADCDTPGRAYGVYVSGSYAYVADRLSGLQIIDLSNPVAPTIVKCIDTPGEAWKICLSGDACYIADYSSTDMHIVEMQIGWMVHILGGSDPDISTTWDGLMEYRADFHNDGTWDTKFSESNRLFIPYTANCNIFACEVKDRFRALDKITFTLDDTPPTTPIVTDEGDSTASIDTLYASWTSEEPDSEIVDYKYKITQGSPIGTVIRDWTSAGIYNYVTAGGLHLTEGETYYFAVKAKNSVGLWSNSGYSDGIMVLLPEPPILNPIGSKSVNEGELLEFTMSATDPNGDALQYPIPVLPENAEFVDNGDDTATFSWTPSYEQAGNYSVTFTVSDGELEDTETITINVIDVHEYTVSLWGSIGDYSTIKIYGDGRIKIIRDDGRVIEGLLGEYLYASPNVYWKIYIRDDLSLERFEIYQQQGDNKVLLAKRFYDGNNRIIADMSACMNPIRIGLKNYDNFSKTIFYIYANNPKQLLVELTMENLQNYLHREKTVYLYDAEQIFEHIPLFSFTDPQLLADQPIITIYYQNNENNIINSWHYKNMPDSIFVVNNDADILSLLTNVPERNPVDIDYIIQEGDDIRILHDQTISLPTRDVIPHFDNHTGILRFSDATTWETVAEVRYPEFNDVVIDDISYEITTIDGVLTLIPLNKPPDISLIPDSLTKDEGDTITAAEIELATDPDGDALTYTYSGWIDSLPYTIGYDDQGEHTLHVEVSDGTDSVGKDITIIVNNVNERPQMLSLTNLWNKYFIWLGRDKEDGYRIKYSYRVDEKEWSMPARMRWISISQISQGLEPGNHIFQVKAIDTEGAESETKKIEFRIEGNTPPQMLYLRNIRNYYLFWLGRDKEDGYSLKYSYRIDGGEWSYPSTRRWLLIRYLRLKPGNHVFEVKAIDRKGLVSEIKSIEFIK